MLNPGKSSIIILILILLAGCQKENGLTYNGGYTNDNKTHISDITLYTKGKIIKNKIIINDFLVRNASFERFYDSTPVPLRLKSVNFTGDNKVFLTFPRYNQSDTTILNVVVEHNPYILCTAFDTVKIFEYCGAIGNLPPTQCDTLLNMIKLFPRQIIRIPCNPITGWRGVSKFLPALPLKLQNNEIIFSVITYCVKSSREWSGGVSYCNVSGAGIYNFINPDFYKGLSPSDTAVLLTKEYHLRKE